MAESCAKAVPEDIEVEIDSQKGKYLTYAIGKEDYGIEIRHVTEIIGIQKITEVPDMPPFIRGVINLRGKIIPVMDVRLRFGMPQREYDERTCIIVVQISDQLIGLVVDEVSEVVEIADSQIEPSPGRRNGSGGYIQGMGKIGDEVKILLSIENFITTDDITTIQL